MTQDDPPQTDPTTVAAWLIQTTPRAQALPPDERLQLQQRVEALIIRARGLQPRRQLAPTMRAW